MSTNDTVLVWRMDWREMQKSEARIRIPEFSERTKPCFCLELAKMIVRDGEGVHRVVTVRVNDAKTVRDADAAARARGKQRAGENSWHGGGSELGAASLTHSVIRRGKLSGKSDIGYSSAAAKKFFGV